jgi:hypothetical protein
MAQKRVVAPDTPITAYPTPEIANIVITVDVDSRLPGYKALEYGTLYPDQTRYPGAKLIAQTPLEDDRFVRRIYATDRIKQETYNYAIKFSAGSPDHPIYTRTFIESRDTYTPLPDNSPDSVIPGAYLVDEEAAPAGGELNNLYLEVTRIYETLPGPWVPSSRYDDDLGLVQTRRRSVVNEGQVATLSADKRVSYEARDGSTGVYIELEESWSIAPDDEGNSLFPIRDRDFYDASRGPVQERRQLFVPTGNEQGTLENVDGVITQTSYEPYNEYLSAKVIQTYSVNGPQLIGQATNNEGQLVTITTQRKGADGYVAPNPTATKTVEVSREDAESLIERVVDAPNVFDGKILSASKPDVIPEAFRASVPAETTQETVAQTSASMPSLDTDDLEKSEQRVNEHTVRKTATSRDNGELPVLDGIDYEEQFDVQIPYKEKIVSSISEVGESSEADPLSDEFLLVREYDKDAIESYLENFSETHPTSINLDLPKVLKDINVRWDIDTQKGTATGETIGGGTLTGSVELSDLEEIIVSQSMTPVVEMEFEDLWGRNLPATNHIFFIRNPVTSDKILQKLGGILRWPVLKPTSHVVRGLAVKLTADIKASIGIAAKASEEQNGYIGGKRKNIQHARTVTPISIVIPPCLHKAFKIQEEKAMEVWATATATVPATNVSTSLSVTISQQEGTVTGEPAFIDINIPSTNYQSIPTGTYMIDSNVEFFKYGFSIVKATTVNISTT